MSVRSVFALLVAVASASSTEAAADANSSRTTVTVEVDAPAYDAFQQLLDEEARDAMAAGKYRRAWNLFWRLLLIDPDDARALREAGRVAQALGRFSYAIEAFARVESLAGAVPDPELHFLRGEALHALGRDDEAEREWIEAEQELAVAPLDRRGTLWLARIAALRGELDVAVAYYEGLIPNDDPGSATSAEVMVALAEAYTLSHDWARAERVLRSFLRSQPDHAQGRAMLAWILDAQGEIDESLALHADLATEWTEHPRKTLEYARALERVYDYPAALGRYREARSLGVEDLDDEIARLEDRVSPELSAGLSVRGDPSGSIVGWMAGASMRLGTRRRIALSAVRESSSDGLAMEEDTSSSVAGWGILTTRRGANLALGASVRQSDRARGFGVSALANTNPQRALQLQVRGDYDQPWRESSSTIREGGVVDTIALQIYGAPGARRLLIGGGVQVRRLGLATRPGDPAQHATQVIAALGVDYALTRSPTRVARGEVLDGEMLTPRALSSATVLSARHYELTSDDPFGERLVLVERSRIDELSTTVRRVLDRRGIVAGEVRAGAGYDWIRGVRLFRAGGSLLLSATQSSRFTFDYDVASESGTGLLGRRHSGSVVLHVDL